MKIGNVDSAQVRHHARRARVHTVRSAKFVHRHALSSRKRIIATLIILLLVPIVLVQLFYPGDRLLPNTAVGTVYIGGDSKKEATQKLDAAYEAAKVPVYFSDSDEVAVEPTLSDLGFEIKNESRVEAYGYPFIARLVPYSLFWYKVLMGKGEPQVSQNDDTLTTYVTTRFGEDCEFEPVNGTISYIDGKLQVVDAARGGSCDPAEMLAKLRGVGAQLNPSKVTINGTSTAPEISTKTAQAEYDRLMKEINDGLSLKVEDKTETVKKDLVAQWVTYSVLDGKLSLSIDTEKADAWISEKYGKQFTSDAGVSVVTLRDYAELSREKGKSGQFIDTQKTNEEIINDLRGEQDTAKLVIGVIDPAVEYKRTYSPSNAALSSIMKKYADTHTGTYGVKLVELSGERRNASYNSTHVFTTASTYKLFVAYSILLRIERGEISWDDPSYGGQSVSTCFNRMLQLSNNECAVWFLLKVSYAGVTADAHALGATHTNFVLSTGITSTAEDEAYFLSLLYSNQLLSQQASRDRFIETMKGNVYVAGIPSGIPNATIADKVGFLDGLLHDAAIVYSPKGNYVLIIMTDNAAWSNIAELAGELEAAR